MTGPGTTPYGGHAGPVLSVAYAPDGATLATGGDDGTVRIWNPRNGKQIDGTGFGAPRTIGRPLAGVRSDSPSTDDLIGVTSDVETLAGLIAAIETAPPLAIALIGDWGAGKSSVMLQIQHHIDVLAEMSTNNPGLSVFAANVRQVRFNAWDYSDDQVWSGLVEHLFHVLAADPETSSDPPDPGSVQAQRVTLRRELAEQETEGQRLSDRLRAADRARQPKGFLEGLGSPAYSWRIVVTAARELTNEIRRARWILLGWAVLGAAAYLAWSIWGSLIGAAAAAVAAVIAPAAVIWQRLRAWHRAGKGVTVRLRRRLDERQRDINKQVADLKERLALIDASARLSTFLSDRATPRAYQEFRGLLGQVRNDLTRLSADLTAARTEWRISGAPMPPPLERIVLYIDDLDRCPPRRVVEVLEAVHLMLALDLFVVVVAVDARWLIQSLEYHYRQLFGTSDGSVPTASIDSRGLSAYTVPLSPVDYLDKIFQIPYVLAPPPPTAMASYLRSLLPRPGSPTPTQQPSGKVSGPESTPIEASAASYAERKPDAIGAEDIAKHDDQFIGPQAPPLDAHPQGADEPESHAHKESRVAGRTEETGNAIPDLRPLGLQLSQPEVEFMARLGPLLPTPRAAKKLANLYRLVRIGISGSGLAAFTGSEAGGPYQAVQILLALLVGTPSAARQIFQEIMSAPEDNDILTILTKAAATDLTEEHVFARISMELAEIAENTRLLINIKEYQQWCPRLARYSFHTRMMVPTPKRSAHNR